MLHRLKKTSRAGLEPTIVDRKKEYTRLDIHNMVARAGRQWQKWVRWSWKCGYRHQHHELTFIRGLNYDSVASILKTKMVAIGGIWKIGNIGFYVHWCLQNDPWKFQRVYQKLHMDHIFPTQAYGV